MTYSPLVYAQAYQATKLRESQIWTESKPLSYSDAVSNSFVFNLKFKKSPAKVDALPQTYAIFHRDLMPLQYAINRLTTRQRFQWIRLRLEILAEKSNDNAIIVFDAPAGGWRICAWIKADHVLATYDPGFVRACPFYAFVKLLYFPRAPMRNKDFISKRLILKLTTLDSFNSPSADVSAPPSTVNLPRLPTTARTEECTQYNPTESANDPTTECVAVDLYRYNSEEYDQACLNELGTSSNCYSACCLTLYADSEFCVGVPMQCG